MSMFDCLEALYVRVRKMQSIPDGSPRLKPALIVAAMFYPVAAGVLILLFGQPSRPSGSLPAYFRLPPTYAAAFVLASLIAVIFFDRRRLLLEQKFVRMRAISSVPDMLLLAFTLVCILCAQAILVRVAPGLTLVAFIALMVAGNVFARRFK